MTTIAYIKGDSLYGSDVTIYVGGTLKDQVKAIVDKAVEDDMFAGYIFSEFPESRDVTDWESITQYEKFLTEIFTKDLTCLNSELPGEFYFYISVQTEENWLDHFKYITAGRNGVGLTKVNLETGEKTEIMKFQL